MRNLVGPAIGTGCGDGFHRARNNAEAFVDPELLSGVEQHLHAETNTQQRTVVGGHFFERIHETALAKFGHAVGKCPHPRQDHKLCGVKHPRFVGENHPPAASLDPPGHTKKVAQSVVHNRHFEAHGTLAGFAHVGELETFIVQSIRHGDSVGVSFTNDRDQMFKSPHSAAGNHRHTHCHGDSPQQIYIKTFASAFAIDGCEQDLAGPKFDAAPARQPRTGGPPSLTRRGKAIMSDAARDEKRCFLRKPKRWFRIAQ